MIKVITSWPTLMAYAKELGTARKSGDPERIAKAESAYKSYEAMVLASDQVLMGRTVGEIGYRSGPS